MRKLLLTMALVAMLVVPAAAQFRGLMGGITGEDLLLVEAVQKELKLSDKVKDALGEVRKKAEEAGKAAREAFMDGDTDKAREIGKKGNEERAKALTKVREGLSSDQQKRLTQLEIQTLVRMKLPEAFKHKSVEKVLALTEKQKESLKETMELAAKDVKEIQDDAKGDRKKFFESFKRINEVRGEAFDKITGSLTADQKKALADVQGDKFEFPMGKGKSKREGKKDDF